ncbi:MAG: GGDEF domain-containing response regulator [Syntrophaceae bacterium]
MNDEICLLVIEDDSEDIYLIRHTLSDSKEANFNLCICNRLSEALEMLNKKSFDAILLDLGLPDSLGVDTFDQIFNNCGDIPIIILSGLVDEEFAFMAVRKGAQDYLMKNEITPALLKRVINYSIERSLLQNKLFKMSMTDELTGLYNRRGFLTVAQQNLDLAKRLQKKVGLFLLDLDGMKAINDHFGHIEGDRALSDIASILKESCRDADVIGRWGGDEFVIFALVENNNDIQLLDARIRNRTMNHNNIARRKYFLSVSIGTLCIDADGFIDIQRSLDEADRLMYSEKAGKKMSEY